MLALIFDSTTGVVEMRSAYAIRSMLHPFVLKILIMCFPNYVQPSMDAMCLRAKKSE